MKNRPSKPTRDNESLPGGHPPAIHGERPTAERHGKHQRDQQKTSRSSKEYLTKQTKKIQDEMRKKRIVYI